MRGRKKAGQAKQQPVVLSLCKCGKEPELRASRVGDFSVLCLSCGRHTKWCATEKAAASNWRLNVLSRTALLVGQRDWPETNNNRGN